MTTAAAKTPPCYAPVDSGASSDPRAGNAASSNHIATYVASDAVVGASATLKSEASKTCPGCGDEFEGDDWQTRCRPCFDYECDQRDEPDPRDNDEDEFWPIDHRRDV